MPFLGTNPAARSLIKANYSDPEWHKAPNMQSMLQQTQTHMEQDNDTASQPKLRRTDHSLFVWGHPLVPRTFESDRLHHPRHRGIVCRPRVARNRSLPHYFCGNRRRYCDPFGRLHMPRLAPFDTAVAGCALGTCRQRLGLQFGRWWLGVPIAAGGSCSRCCSAGKWSVRTAQIAIDRRIYPAVFAGLIRTFCGN